MQSAQFFLVVFFGGDKQIQNVHGEKRGSAQKKTCAEKPKFSAHRKKIVQTAFGAAQLMNFTTVLVGTKI